MLRKFMTLGVPAIAIVILAIVWWVNGSDLEDAWLYAFSAIIILIPAVDTHLKDKRK